MKKRVVCAFLGLVMMVSQSFTVFALFFNDFVTISLLFIYYHFPGANARSMSHNSQNIHRMAIVHSIPSNSLRDAQNFHQKKRTGSFPRFSFY